MWLYCTLFGLLPLLPDSHPTVPAPEPASLGQSCLLAPSLESPANCLARRSSTWFSPAGACSRVRLPCAFRLLGRLCLHPGAYICKVALCCAGMAAPSISWVKTDFVTTVKRSRLIFRAIKWSRSNCRLLRS